MGDDWTDEFGAPLSNAEFLMRLNRKGTDAMHVAAKRQLREAVERDRRAGLVGRTKPTDEPEREP